MTSHAKSEGGSAQKLSLPDSRQRPRTRHGGQACRASSEPIVLVICSRRSMVAFEGVFNHRGVSQPQTYQSCTHPALPTKTACTKPSAAASNGAGLLDDGVHCGRAFLDDSKDGAVGDDSCRQQRAVLCLESCDARALPEFLTSTAQAPIAHKVVQEPPFELTSSWDLFSHTCFLIWSTSSKAEMTSLCIVPHASLTAA